MRRAKQAMGEELTRRKPRKGKGRRECVGEEGGWGGVRLPETSFLLYDLACLVCPGLASSFLTARSHRRRPGCYDNISFSSLFCHFTHESRLVMIFFLPRVNHFSKTQKLPKGSPTREDEEEVCPDLRFFLSLCVCDVGQSPKLFLR